MYKRKPDPARLDKYFNQFFARVPDFKTTLGSLDEIRIIDCDRSTRSYGFERPKRKFMYKCNEMSCGLTSCKHFSIGIGVWSQG